jgi:hypothetical protein
MGGNRWDTRDIFDKSRLLERLKEMTKYKDGHNLYYGAFVRSGHVRIQIGKDKYLVHRVSAYIHFDFDLKSEWKVLHKQTCPYKSCWNPDCIYIGDQSDNNRDAYAIGTRNKNSLRDRLRERSQS